MKIKNLFSLLFVCAVGFAAVSCSDDDDPKWNCDDMDRHDDTLLASF